MAVLGFEYGYALSEPHTCCLGTIWRLCKCSSNNDQFIASAERKWARANGLVMLYARV